LNGVKLTPKWNRRVKKNIVVWVKMCKFEEIVCF